MELAIGTLIVLVVALSWVSFLQTTEINKSKRNLKELLVRLDPEYKYAYFDDLTKMVECIELEANRLNSKIAELEFANSKYIEKLYPDEHEPEDDEEDDDVNDKDNKPDFEFLDFPCPSEECAGNGNYKAAQWKIGTFDDGKVCVTCSSCETEFSLDLLTRAKFRYEIMVDFLQSVQKAIDTHKEWETRREALTKMSKAPDQKSSLGQVINSSGDVIGDVEKV